jgi:Leucine-rich repeat (LRR) protein
MKKLLLVLLCLPMIGFGQNVNIPDANFKAYLVGNTAINTNGDTEIQVSEAAAFNGGIYCQSMSISNLTGIEAFTALIYLHCSLNQLSSLNLSQNTALTYLSCDGNQLTSLDVSANTALTDLWCYGNQLTSLDVRNGNNTNLYFYASSNPNLTCINVDNATWSTANWTIANQNIDSQSYFSNNCSGTTEVEEQTTNKALLKVTDLLGRETKATNQLLFYIYNDGTVEKKVVIE